MKQRVADYIADFFVNHQIKHVFTVTGGGAMYLNDALGHHPELHCTYNHHEQASAMAAEAYARIDNHIAAVCVTSGPGATNAITGVVGGWMDSIPMLILSGQARYATTVYASGLRLRTRGVQEFDIIGSVQNMTKYAVVVSDPKKIRYCLEKALYLAYEGRPGPCWLDIPLDIQGVQIESDGLTGYDPPQRELPDLSAKAEQIIHKITGSKRPIVYIGNGVRLSGAHLRMLKLVHRLNVPVITSTGSIDAIASDHPLYVGRIGMTGDRAGNYAMQNADLFISFGGRLSFSQTGFAHEAWAPNAYKIINNVDPEELKKDSLHADVCINCNVADLIEAILKKLGHPLPPKEEWLKSCMKWKQKYPVIQDRHLQDKKPNIYAFFGRMTKRLGKTDCLVVSVGTSRVVGSQASFIKEGMRFITNPSTAAMGYDLPAAIGVCEARHQKKTYLVTGDGSLQMNLQELQTIVQNRLPIMIFVMNNQGYQSIRTTQKTYFSTSLVGVGSDSGDLSFPDLSMLSSAYGLPYLKCESMETMPDAIEWALSNNGPGLCEMILSITQKVEPRVLSQKKPDGSFISGTLENMFPFLPQDEIEENMKTSQQD